MKWSLQRSLPSRLILGDWSGVVIRRSLPTSVIVPQQSPSSSQPLSIKPSSRVHVDQLASPNSSREPEGPSLFISDKSPALCTRWLRVEHWSFFYHAPTFASSRPVSLDCAYPIPFLNFYAPLRTGHKSHLRFTRGDQSESSFSGQALLEAVLVLCTRPESDGGRTSSTRTIQLSSQPQLRNGTPHISSDYPSRVALSNSSQPCPRTRLLKPKRTPTNTMGKLTCLWRTQTHTTEPNILPAQLTNTAYLHNTSPKSQRPLSDTPL